MPALEPDSDFQFLSPAAARYASEVVRKDRRVPDDSVTNWLGRLTGGDPAAAGPLWDRYFPRLVELARARLRAFPRRAADEEDVALSAFDSFCRDAAAGRFPRLGD